jgi:TFIIF-interacting CTD phosphatase-like protein
MKKNVFLDLDNTLISAEAVEEFPFKKKGVREKAVRFDIHDMDGYYIVFERPGVQEFLDWLFAEYNVSVWTAASKDYALFIIERVLLKKPNRKLDYILFSYHCDLSKKIHRSHKQLKLVFDTFQLPGYTEDNTVIIDDLHEVQKCQPNNAFQIHAFHIHSEGSENDRHLVSMRKLIAQRLRPAYASHTASHTATAVSTASSASSASSTASTASSTAHS